MDRPALMAIVLVLLVILLVLMALGWRARLRRQKAVAIPFVVPGKLGRVVGTFAGKYVATTASGDPLDRVAVHGLGFRGSATVTVTADGLVVSLVGRDEFWIPAIDILGQRRATWTIDRVVEPDGLQLVEWTLGDRTVDSYFRFDSPATFERAVRELTATERQVS